MNNPFQNILSLLQTTNIYDGFKEVNFIQKDYDIKRLF